MWYVFILQPTLLYKQNWSIEYVCDRIRHRSNHSSTFVINTPMDKSLAPMCLPVHKELKNPCFGSVFRLVYNLKTFVYIAVTKKFMTIFFLMNSPFFWTPCINMLLEKNLYLGGCTNLWQKQWAKNKFCAPLHSKVIMDNVKCL